MKKVMAMAILVMLVFVGGASAKIVSRALITDHPYHHPEGKILGDSPVDKEYAYIRSRQAWFEYLRLKKKSFYGKEKDVKTFRDFLKKRMKTCEDWLEKKVAEYCKEEMNWEDPTSCQTVVINWISVREGCNYDELKWW